MKKVKKVKKKKVKEEVKRSNQREEVTEKKPSHYIDKQELLEEIIACQKANQVSDKLAEFFNRIIEGVSHRFPNLQYYDVSEDVKQDCHLLLIQKLHNFKAKKKTSCFAYFTTVIYNQIRYQLSRTRRYKDHKDQMVDKVMNYMETHRDHFLDSREDE